jgi:predicted NAD-dependent protein-ADP-ribosyltransferase YbiA (DUF1768 family)
MEDASAGVGPIYFYERDQPFYEFTNFAEFPIVVDGKRVSPSCSPYRP